MTNPDRFTRHGRALFAAAVGALGVQCLLGLRPVSGLEPLPAWLPLAGVWAGLSAVILIAAGLGTTWGGRHARLAATVLAGFLSLWLVVLHLPRLVASPANGGFWTGAFETLAVASAAWVLAAEGTREPTPRRTLEIRLGQVGYGVSLPAFGVLHVIYWQYVSSVIPAWLPGHLFWTYFTAAAFFAAGASLVTGFKARLAATWTGIMFLLWVLMLHLPRVVADAGSHAEWTSLLVALAMGGGAWVVAQSLSRTQVGSHPRKDSD